MQEPTKADLAAAVARLTEENAALRDLLTAARAYAKLPHPADYSGSVYTYEAERRLDAIAVWADGDREDMTPDVYLLVMGDRAKHLREEAARPVRYEVRAEPAQVVSDEAANPPHHVIPAEQACTAPGWDDSADSGYMCTAQNGHAGPDHIAYKPGGGEYHRWPADAAAKDEPCSTDAAGVLSAAITAGTPVVVTDDEPEHKPAPERFISGAPWCTASKGDLEVGRLLCELPTGHGGDHRAPGAEEGDPDITWSDEAAVSVTA
jgi:hypothetical protein